MKKTIKLLMLSAICALLLTGCRKKLRTLLNKRLRQALKREDLPSGGAYRKALDIDEES